MKRKILIIIVAIFMVAAVTAGTLLFTFPYQPDQPPKANDTGSTEEGIQEVVNANNEFAFDLYSKLEENENVFFSPYSISSALAMTYEGAKNQTANEMRDVFNFPEDEILRPNFGAIYNKINRGARNYELRTGNALWVQEDYPFLDNYLNTVEKYYGGKATNLDFEYENEKSRQIINEFIEEQTNNKIQDLIPKGRLNPLTKLILTNAIYFRGDWKYQFDMDDTEEKDFFITPNETVKTDMMYMGPEDEKFKYLDTRNEENESGETPEFQMLKLPYKGDELSMTIILPKENINEFESYLTLEKFEEHKDEMKNRSLEEISLPKFEFDTKYFMKDTLSDLGMPIAFSSNADFSGMTGQRNLFIGSVIHQAYIDVDEKGTEAAAATAVGMVEVALPVQNIFRADRPFIFMIQEKETDNILFMGRVNDPTQ